MKPVAVVFDLFGTLLDIASLQAAAAQLTTDPATFVTTWRDKQIAYAFASTLMGRYLDFDDVTERALRFAMARHGIAADARAIADLTGRWRRLEPFADARDALVAIGAYGLPRAVLTNGTPATAYAALAHAGLAGGLDVTISVDAIGAYKPKPAVYTLATKHFATTPDRLIFVTSNGWDATGATTFGLRVAWCNRAGAPPETLGDPPEWTLRDLSTLAELVAAAH